jgi:hypothetical protein
MAEIIMQLRTTSLLILAAWLGLATTACTSARDREAQREAEYRREQTDRNSAAYRAGQAAHELAEKAGHAAAVAGRKLDESARKAREGWKDQAQRDREQRDH